MTGSLTPTVGRLGYLMVSLKQKADRRVQNWEPKIVTGCCWELNLVPLIATGCCLEPTKDSLTLMVDRLEHLMVSLKQKADPKEPNLVPLIAMDCYLEQMTD